jgi:hypothetical protein
MITPFSLERDVSIAGGKIMDMKMPATAGILVYFLWKIIDYY